MGRQPWLVYNLMKTAEEFPQLHPERDLVPEPFLNYLRSGGTIYFITY